MENKSFLKIGHRGACGYEPENTLRSFKKALDLGVDTIELDVHKTKDEATVVIHDEKVDKTTNGTGFVADKSLEEIKKLDAGKGEKIPTLEEVLDLVNRKAQVNIELKGEGTARPVADIIEKYVKEKNWKNDDFLVSSFNYNELKQFKDLKTNIKIGLISSDIPSNWAELTESLEAYSINLGKEAVNQEFVNDAHKKGLKVFIWTADDENDIRAIRALGVDGICSNFPDRL